MAKPIITKYNPVELLQSNSTYQPLNGFFFDRLKNFEDLIQYPQKYQNSDTLVLQFQLLILLRSADLFAVDLDFYFVYKIYA